MRTVACKSNGFFHAEDKAALVQISLKIKIFIHSATLIRPFATPQNPTSLISAKY